MVLNRVWEAITHPLTLGASGILALAGISKGGLVWAALATFWSQAGSLFGASSITLFASQYLPFPTWVTGTAVIVGVAAFPVVVAKAVRRYLNGLEARTK